MYRYYMIILCISYDVLASRRLVVSGLSGCEVANYSNKGYMNHCWQMLNECILRITHIKIIYREIQMDWAT